MRAGEKEARKVLSEKGFREMPAVKRGESTLTLFVGRPGDVIIQSYSDKGYEVFVPVDLSNNTDDTTAALLDFVNKE